MRPAAISGSRGDAATLMTRWSDVRWMVRFKNIPSFGDNSNKKISLESEPAIICVDDNAALASIGEAQS